MENQPNNTAHRQFQPKYPSLKLIWDFFVERLTTSRGEALRDSRYDSNIENTNTFLVVGFSSVISGGKHSARHKSSQMACPVVGRNPGSL